MLARGACAPTKSISTSSSLCACSLQSPTSSQSWSVVSPRGGSVLRSSFPLPEGRPEPVSSGMWGLVSGRWSSTIGLVVSTSRNGGNFWGTLVVGGTRCVSCHSKCSAKLRLVRFWYSSKRFLPSSVSPMAVMSRARHCLVCSRPVFPLPYF